MQPGSLVCAQRIFWADEAEKISKSKTRASKISVSPGDMLLLTQFKYGKSEYPIYDYFTIEFFVAGSRWSTTVAINDKSEIEEYIQVFESPTLLQRG